MNGTRTTLQGRLPRRGMLRTAVAACVYDTSQALRFCLSFFFFE